MLTIFVDAINGNDLRNGSSEALAVRSIKRALMLIGTFSEDANNYSTQVGTSVRIFLLPGDYLCLKTVNLLSVFFLSFIIEGYGATIVSYKKAFHVNLHIHPFALINLSIKAASPNLTFLTLGSHSALLNNVSVGNFSLLLDRLGSGSATLNNLSTTLEIPTWANAVNCASLTDAILVSGVAVATPAAIQQGKGAILPPPTRSFNASLVPNFITEGWIDDPSYAEGDAEILAWHISIFSGNSARALGPVWQYPRTISFSTHYFEALEETTHPSGQKHVIDSTKDTTERTIEVRVSDIPFLNTDLSPSWHTISALGNHPPLAGRFVQYRITLRIDGK